MPFTVADFHDLARLLYEHPEWRAEVRRLVLTDEILELPALVHRLAEEQHALAEAQRRTEQRVEELAEAQRRTEERVGRLEMAMAELAEAQRALTEAHRSLETRFGQFQAIFGATVEDEASGVLRVVLREKGYQPLAEPYSLPVDGEVDVILPLKAPDGNIVWAVAEAKARLSYSDVRAWAQRMKSEWRRRLATYQVPGPFLVYAFGIRVDRGAIEEAEQQGIGLLTGQGERVAPKGLIGVEEKK